MKKTLIIILVGGVLILIGARFSFDSTYRGGEASGTLAGRVSVGPFCPVERPGKPCPVPPEAYTSRSVVVFTYESQPKIAAKISLDSSGRYRVELLPGTYIVEVIDADHPQHRSDRAKVVGIQSGKTIEINFDIDTGIR